MVNIFIVYKISPKTSSDIFTLESSLFGAVKLTKDAEVRKYKHSRHCTRFDSKGEFSHPSGRYGRNVIIFGADLSSSRHANNRTNNVLVLVKDFIQRINGTTIYLEQIYSTNFIVTNQKVCFSLHYNGDSSYLFVNGKEIINFKAKDSEIVPCPLCLGNISKDLSPRNTTHTGLYGYIYDFSVDYRSIANDKILDIHNYLMKRNNII